MIYVFFIFYTCLFILFEFEPPTVHSLVFPVCTAQEPTDSQDVREQLMSEDDKRFLQSAAYCRVKLSLEYII